MSQSLSDTMINLSGYVLNLFFVSITKLHFFYALPQKAHFFFKSTAPSLAQEFSQKYINIRMKTTSGWAHMTPLSLTVSGNSASFSSLLSYFPKVLCFLVLMYKAIKVSLATLL